MAESVQAGHTVHKVGLVQASPWSAVCVRDPCIEMAARFCFLNLSPVSHQEPFLVGIYFLRVHNFQRGDPKLPELSSGGQAPGSTGFPH